MTIREDWDWFVDCSGLFLVGPCCFSVVTVWLQSSSCRVISSFHLPEIVWISPGNGWKDGRMSSQVPTTMNKNKREKAAGIIMFDAFDRVGGYSNVDE